MIARTEHPTPNAYREDWKNLNGEWEFFLDAEAVSDDEKDLVKETLPQVINVPFCPESDLSGIGEKGFIKRVFYRKKITVPKEWKGRRVLLHIGACDYDTAVYCNGKKIAHHLGGYTPITADMTDALKDGENVICVSALDDIQTGRHISGKQSRRLESYGCYYTRTTGIWQTVWMEAVGYECHIAGYTVDAELTVPSVTLVAAILGNAVGKMLTAVASYEGRTVGVAQVMIASDKQSITLPLSEKHLWEAGNGRLYDLTLRVEDESGLYDELNGYFGLRNVRLQKDGFYLNGEKVFLRTVLDQGFYPDGIYTAPTADALKKDIELSMQLGFNGARLHQKVFEPLFLYYADKLGYLVFGECGNWGWDPTKCENIYSFLPEWLEEMERDQMHSSIIGWCPLNETWDVEGRQHCNEMLEMIYDVTHAKDSTRPVIANSGSYPIRSDVNDIHDYEQNPEKLKETFAYIDQGEIHCQLWRKDRNRQSYNPALPLFVSEYGGIGWSIGQNGWGYGQSVKSEEEFLARLEGLTDVLLSVPEVFGFCYTQLYDVEQERNGILTYERELKFPAEKIAPIFAKPRKI